MNAILNAILLSDLETRPGPSKVTLHWGSECVLKWLYVVILGFGVRVVTSLESRAQGQGG